jgi:hypothetical protein
MCPQSVARRAKKNQTQENTSDSGQKEANTVNFEEAKRTTYKTGYTKHQSKFNRAWNKYKVKKENRKSSANTSGFFKELLKFVRSFIKSPVAQIINPPNIGKATMLAIAAIQGAVIWLSMYFVCTGVNRSIFSVLGSALGFGGIAGYSGLVKMFISLLMGAVTGIVFFFLYTGVFWCINRFILKSNTAYWDFSTRLSLTGIPLTVLGIFGVVFSFFSLTTLMILLMCGAISFVVLTYEALRTEWINKSPGTVMYSMMAGFFVLITVICYLIRIS